MTEQVFRPPNFAEDSATYGRWLRVLHTEEMFERLERDECIDLSLAKKVLDFGAGIGIPTSVLTRLLEPGATIEAVEEIPEKARAIIDDGILPADKVFAEEGIEFLRSRPEQYDLITAFAFGSDAQGKLAPAFIRYAQDALVPNGNILITSDEHTMAAFRAACDDLRADYEVIPGIPDLNGFVHHIVVIAKKDLSIPDQNASS